MIKNFIKLKIIKNELKVKVKIFINNIEIN